MVLKGRFFQLSHQEFTRPDWLSEDFPMHRWYKLHNEDDWQQLIKSHQIDDKAWRPAHYIEWFTHRLFYDACFLTTRPLLLNPMLHKKELRHRCQRLT